MTPPLLLLFVRGGGVADKGDREPEREGRVRVREGERRYGVDKEDREGGKGWSERKGKEGKGREGKG